MTAPDPSNRVALDRNGRITLSYRPNIEEGHTRLIGKLKRMLKDIRCHDHLIPLNAHIPARIPLAGVAHQNGTVRFGADPERSALDRNCKAHDVDNPLCRRCERLPVERRGESGADDHGERAQGR